MLTGEGRAAMDYSRLEATARALVEQGKGILAADESLPTMERRLAQVGMRSTEENRRAWREVLFTTPDIGRYLSGVILYEESVGHKTEAGKPLIEVLNDQGIIPGVKVDEGTQPLPGSPEEQVTEGLDGLRQRLRRHAEMGARFTKWRAAIKIGDGTPTAYSMRMNAQAMARYAALSQEAGLVPIVEPETLMDGEHDIQRCFETTEAVLHHTFRELVDQGVYLEGLLLKVNMVLSGREALHRAGPDEVAAASIRCYKRTTPAAVPGIVFLSGGQDEREATENLNAIARRADGTAPWQMTFSYSRALEMTPLEAWAREPNNVRAAQQAFLHRVRLCSAARRGEYTPEMETAA
jgi:fructose-bisphosphate aldolase class I